MTSCHGAVRAPRVLFHEQAAADLDLQRVEVRLRPAVARRDVAASIGSIARHAEAMPAQRRLDPADHQRRAAPAEPVAEREIDRALGRRAVRREARHGVAVEQQNGAECGVGLIEQVLQCVMVGPVGEPHPLLCLVEAEPPAVDLLAADPAGDGAEPARGRAPSWR